MSTVTTDRVKEVTTLASARDIYNIVIFVRNTSRGDDSAWSELDFRGLCRTPAERIDPYWTEVLSNELLGELGSARLIIVPPETPSGLKNLDRTGMTFAIKRRDAAATSVRFSSSGNVWPASDWSRSWSPYDSRFRRKLFEHNYEPDVLLDREFVTFLNPHLYATSYQLRVELEDELENQAAGWITELIRRDNIENTLLDDLCHITSQLVSNLSHAFQRQPAYGKCLPSTRQHSYAQLYTTRGGGEASHNRLHMVVTDLGHGIVTTLLPKLEATLGARYGSSSSVIQRLLEGKLPSYGRAGGEGYEQIVDLVHKHSGELILTTGHDRISDGFDVVRARLKGGQNPTVDLDERWRFFGTTAHVVIPLT